MYGKVFHRVRGAIGGTKSTKEVIEFYYVWKKTSHGKRWKGSFAREITDSDSDGDDVGAVGGRDDDGGGSEGRRSAAGPVGVDGGGAAGGGGGKVEGCIIWIKHATYIIRGVCVDIICWDGRGSESSGALVWSLYSILQNPAGRHLLVM